MKLALNMHFIDLILVHNKYEAVLEVKFNEALTAGVIVCSSYLKYDSVDWLLPFATRPIRGQNFNIITDATTRIREKCLSSFSPIFEN